ncbi:MAG: hypothetical protein MUC36_10900 [Planctomycetes bacterium]|jgi:hypothetical protein|nr:hypothetical protein [Planctomycetota bacterium]
MRLLTIALLGILVVTWVMLVDLWPTLPERIPLLPPGLDATDPFVERSLAWWFGPPAGATLVALLTGVLGPRMLARRATDGRWNPVPRAGSVRQLAPEARARIVQPIRLGLVGATICPLILVARWWVHVAEAAANGAPSTGGAGVSLTMLTAATTSLGAGWTFSRSRATAELAKGSLHREW